MLVLRFDGQEAVERIEKNKTKLKKNKTTVINSYTAGGEEGQVTKYHPISHQ